MSDSVEQALVPGTSATSATIPFTFDPSKDFHGEKHLHSLMSLLIYPRVPD